MLVHDSKKARRKEVLEIEGLLLGGKVPEALDTVNRVDSTILQVRVSVNMVCLCAAKFCLLTMN